jgi:protein ImuB
LKGDQVSAKQGEKGGASAAYPSVHVHCEPLFNTAACHMSGEPQPAGRLWLALYLPLLPLESMACTEHEQPRVVYVSHAGQHTVYRLNAAATAHGIDPGMPLTAARSLCQQLVAFEHDARHERKTLDGLALWAMRFTSRVSLEPPHGLILEIGASLRLFGGLQCLHETILRGLADLGFSTHHAVAPRPGAAWLLAQEQHRRIITSDDELRPALLSLPLALLPVDDKKKAALARLGLRRIGDCLRLPRDGLARRLGPELLDALDRTLGKIPDTRDYYVPPESFHSQLLLPEPVSSVEPLLFMLKRQLGELAGFLRARDAAAQRLRLCLIKPGLPVENLDICLLQPGRDPQQLFALWRERLERHTLDAAVEGMALQVRQLLPMQPLSMGLLDVSRTSNGEDFIAMLERLKNRLGDRVINQPVSLADHRPEQSARQVAFPARAQAIEPPRLARPLWLLPSPQALTQDANGAPLLHGPLTLLAGPERIEGGWWDSADIRRDYYIALNRRQQRLWIYRQLDTTHEWYLHGFFS